MRYLAALRQRDFGLLWTGATVSTLGDSMTLVALIWLVWERTESAVMLGWLTFAYTAPVVVGGLAAGVLLDRFDKRTVMAVDTALRGLVMASVPVLAALDSLPIWYLFVVAAVYGLLKMIPLAGVPAMMPGLVAPEHLTTANALESISYGVGGIAGPFIAGVLVATVGAPAVIGLDAVTYFVFLAALVLMRPEADRVTIPAENGRAFGFGEAARLFVTSKPMLVTTLMFMAFNVGEGIFSVALPVYSDEVLGAGAAGYGLLAAALSVGLLAGSIFVGAVATPTRLGSAIALAQIASGATLLFFAAPMGLGPAAMVAVLFGLAGSPLTIWAQTVRMRVIAPHLRGRVFALLRTLMQSTPPAGGILGGFIVATGGVGAAFVAAAIIPVAAGVAGLFSRGLREADQPGAGAVEPAL